MKFIRWMCGRHRRQHRGQVRVVDFAVSFSLFIVLISQFFLLLVTVQVNITSNDNPVTNPAERVALRLLGTGGTANWEFNDYSNLSSVNIGLAANSSSKIYPVIDPNKLARLNNELNGLNGLPGQNLGFHTLDYLGLKQELGLAGWDFRITLNMLLKVSVTISSDKTTAFAQISSSSLQLINGTPVTIALIDLSQGTIQQSISGITNTSGYVSLPLGLLNAVDYVVVAIARIGNTWSIGYAPLLNDATKQMVAGQFDSNVNIFENKTWVFSRFLSSTLPDVGSYHATFLSFNTMVGTILSSTIITPPSNQYVIDQNLTNLPRNEPLVGIETAQVSGANTVYWRVFTFPAILNGIDPVSGNFYVNNIYASYPVAGTVAFPSSGSTYSYQTMVQCMNGLFILHIDAWRSTT